jgi:hypothetical protein
MTQQHSCPAVKFEEKTFPLTATQRALLDRLATETRAALVREQIAVTTILAQYDMESADVRGLSPEGLVVLVPAPPSDESPPEAAR